MKKILWGALFLLCLIGPAAAIDIDGDNDGPPVVVPAPVGVPAPEMGEGMLGMLLAAGAVYLIKSRARG